MRACVMFLWGSQKSGRIKLRNGNGMANAFSVTTFKMKLVKNNKRTLEDRFIWIKEAKRTYRLLISSTSASNMNGNSSISFDSRLWKCISTISGSEVKKYFSCSTQLSMTFVLLINLKLLTNANFFLLNTTEQQNFSANKYENANYCLHFHIYQQRKFHAQLSWAWKKTFIDSGPVFK